MKRLLIIFTLLTLLLAPQLARAESFMFGNIFQTNQSLIDNLNALGSSAEFSGPYASSKIDPGALYTYTGIGFSEAADMAGLLLAVGYANPFGNTDDGFRADQEYRAADLTFDYRDLSTNNNMKAFLSEMLMDPIYQVGDVYELENDVTFHIDGEDFFFTAGTLFFSFVIPGSGNASDFIMAATPMSAVPVPAAIWLFGPGMAGLITLRRKLRWFQ